MYQLGCNLNNKLTIYILVAINRFCVFFVEERRLLDVHSIVNSDLNLECAEGLEHIHKIATTFRCLELFSSSLSALPLHHRG